VTRRTLALLLCIFLGFFAALLFFVRDLPFAVLSPAGSVAHDERTLMIQASLLMLIVIAPVLGCGFFFAWHYRAGGKGKYMPHWEHSKLDELIWWAIPFEIVLVLAALTWSSTHALDPKKPLAMSGEPLVVQVVALDWKWLFIYPSEGVATLNYLYMPVGRPVDFEITADAPMNSFWIPQLGGQIYAMTGMTNSLTLEADKTGTTKARSANYSGEGFAHMKLLRRSAVATTNFDQWVATTKNLPSR
jgi:cytochrome o ubiquinol oxidase subunit 2